MSGGDEARPGEKDSAVTGTKPEERKNGGRSGGPCAPESVEIDPYDDHEAETIDVMPENQDKDATGGEAAMEPEAQAEKAPDEAAAGETPSEAALKALRAERDRLYEAWVRSAADFDNYRKRTEREREEYRRFAAESLLLDMLPVLDNFERALEFLPADLPKGFVEGVTLIYKQLQDVLSKQGLSPMETEGEVFDPHLHEAVETEFRTDVPHHQIVGEVQKGYRLGNRVLRPARVKVSVQPEEETIEFEESSSEDAS